MRSFFALIRKDLKGYFDQPTGYILLVIFVSVLSYFFFRDILITKEASLTPLFSEYLPLLLLVFVPAATMRLIAEEHRDGTLEILFTQPISALVVLLTKFLSGFVFVGIGIVATLGIPVALMTAGDLDLGAVGAQYLGTVFLTASYVAIGVFTSSLTRNQIVAFMLSFLIIGALTLAGNPALTLALPSQVAVLVQDLSPITHFQGIARGVLDLRDVLYFAALLTTFASATYLSTRGKSLSHRSGLYRNLRFGVLGLVVLSVLVGWFGRDIEGRWDLTGGRLYTLSPATQDLLDNLDDLVTIKLFVNKDPPVQLAVPTRYVNDFLDDVEAAGKGKVRVIRLYPDVDEDAAQEAERNFIPAVPFNVQSQGEFTLKLGYLGMSASYASKMERIDYVQSLGDLEYSLANTIQKAIVKQPKTVGILYGHGEERRDAGLQVLRNALEQQYRVEEITDIETDVLALRARFVDVLVVPGPNQRILPFVLEELDDWLTDGGKVLFMIDPVEVDFRSGRASVNQESLADYLANYGVRANTDVVFDLVAHETIPFSGRFGVVQLPYKYFVRASTVESKISGGVPSAVLPFASSLELVEPAQLGVELLETTPLLLTSPSGGLDTAFVDLSPQSSRFSDVTEDELAERLLAVALTGTRCRPFIIRCDKEDAVPFRMIVAGNSDWPTILPGSPMMVSLFPENLDLAVNWIDWLMQEDALSAIRSKSASQRHLIFESSAHRSLVQYSNILGVPVLFVLIGLARYLVRRNTSRKVYSRDR